MSGPPANPWWSLPNSYAPHPGDLHASSGPRIQGLGLLWAVNDLQVNVTLVCITEIWSYHIHIWIVDLKILPLSYGRRSFVPHWWDSGTCHLVMDEFIVMHCIQFLYLPDADAEGKSLSSQFQFGPVWFCFAISAQISQSRKGWNAQIQPNRENSAFFFP